MNRLKISFIIPVYNTEKYLRRCIDSLLNQSFSDFELILIDDGSPDNCPKICDEFAKKDKRIKQEEEFKKEFKLEVLSLAFIHNIRKISGIFLGPFLRRNKSKTSATAATG